MSRPGSDRAERWRRFAILGLFVMSGFTGLVYEVLWLKELGLLFGNTSHAAATTLAVFFLGLAAGGYFWGLRAPRLTNSLVAYGLLEIAVGVTGLLYFWLLDLYRWIYVPLYAWLGESLLLLAAAKFLLALGILFPAAFAMGGTLPVVGHHLVRHANGLGRTGALLYALNTLGAAIGAFVAGFYLPLTLGFRNAYLLAIGLSVAIGLAACALGRNAREAAPAIRPAPPVSAIVPGDRAGMTGPTPVWVVAFGSGFLALGLEVAWTRMFAQVLQNSVYTFAIILVVFLVAIGAGSLLATWLCRVPARPRTVLAVLLTLAGLWVSTTPFVFVAHTDGLRYLGSAAGGWGGYVVSIFRSAAMVLLLPGVLVGSVFPYLLRVAEGWRLETGPTIGRLVAVNTTGAILGSLLTGFVLLSASGLWGAIRLLGLAYLVLACLAVDTRSRWKTPLRVVPVLGIALLLSLLDPTRVPTVRVNPERGERVLDLWEGSHGIVAVVERDTGRRLKVNNYYSLGGTAAIEHEQNQALIPLMVHPAPNSVFFLGLGTGITAGAALRQPVRRVVVCELVPEVVVAATRYFDEPAGGLFRDPRAEILVRDGRNQLMGSPERYDLVIADLFIPWRAGAGTLYTKEHFEAARERLTPGGQFVQWLPLYQLSSREFFIIARTMLEVFPDVVVWRGDFYPTKPIVALVGAVDLAPLDPAVVVARGRALAGDRQVPEEAFEAVTLPFYAGNLGAARRLIPPGPINTDDRPLVEYLAPITHRQQRAGAVDWFHAEELAAFYRALLDEVPPEADPYLARLGLAARGYVRAGLSYAEAAVHRHRGREAEADRLFRDFVDRIPVEFRPSTDESGVDTEFSDPTTSGEPGDP